VTKPRVCPGLTIANLLWPQFVSVKGWVFLKAVVGHSIDTRLPTRTEFDENHVHLLDHFTHGARSRRAPFLDAHHRDFISVNDLGRSICIMWARKLRQDFPRWHFRVYFHGFAPTVRFHRVRTKEHPVIGDKDRADEIASGQFLVVDTRRLKS
jgi:hypothetical protein